MAGQEPKSIYRDGFAGRNPAFVRGDANVKFDEKDHKLSTEHGKSGVTSEYIKIEANPPAGSADTRSNRRTGRFVMARSASRSVSTPRTRAADPAVLA